MSELTKIRKNWEPLQNNVNRTHSVALLKLSANAIKWRDTILGGSQFFLKLVLCSYAILHEIMSVSSLFLTRKDFSKGR